MYCFHWKNRVSDEKTKAPNLSENPKAGKTSWEWWLLRFVAACLPLTWVVAGIGMAHESAHPRSGAAIVALGLLWLASGPLVFLANKTAWEES